MITKTIDAWHSYLRGEQPDGLDDLLHEDCVFWSPVMFSPQKGRDITKMYLSAAYAVLPGDGADPSGSGSAFRYTKQILDGNVAVLEFETMVDDVFINGVDIITCDDDGLITEFKVMIRPRRAIDMLQQQMAATIAAISPDPS